MNTKNIKTTFSSHKNLKRIVLIFIFAVQIIALTQVFASEPVPQNNNVNIFADLADKVVPSVVNISTVTKNKIDKSQGNPLFRKHFEEFFNLPPGFRGQGLPFGQIIEPDRQALGTGVVIETQGDKAIVLTNNHVIDGATTINVQFNESTNGGKSMEAKLIGTDPDLDIALLEVKTQNDWKVKALKFGDSDQLRVGEYVMAVGNPFGQGHSVSHGIVSAKDRSAPITGRYLQTDAPINPGNSGGPLVNLKGDIVGINNAILAQAQGIGFAIPSNSIKTIISELKTTGKVKRGFIGVLLGQITPEAAGFIGHKIQPGVPYVVQVQPDSPAERAGLKANDIIVGYNGKPIKTADDLRLFVANSGIDKKAQLEIIRSGKKKTLEIKVETKKMNT